MHTKVGTGESMSRSMGDFKSVNDEASRAAPAGSYVRSSSYESEAVALSAFSSAESASSSEPEDSEPKLEAPEHLYFQTLVLRVLETTKLACLGQV